MADDNRITLIIEGLPEDDGRVRFAAFLSELQSFNATINRLDREANQGRQASYFRIAELSYSSPVRVVLEPHPMQRRPDVGHLIIKSLERVADALADGDELLNLDAELLEDIQGLANPVGKHVKTVALLFSERRLELTQNVAQRVENALAVDEECDGALDGMLEQINIHRGANVFHIYPAVGPNKVACHFPSRLYDDAVSAVGKRVEVFGILRYRARASFPHQIGVRAIQIYSPETDLPDWEDLRGRAPDATDGLPSEEFVRTLRDGW